MGSKGSTLTFAAMGIVINIVFGTAVKMLHLPLLYLDTIGTIFTSVILGPWYGAVTGGLTNIIQGVLTNPKNIPFALVNIAIGVIVGFIAKKYKFDFKTAIITGVILAVIAPLIGTPIAVWIYGGITGDGNDIIFTWLVQSGKTIFTAAFIPRITGNILDKLVSCFLVALLINRIPNRMIKGKRINA
ncbi:CD3073 family putative ECF transporter S component [Crassaminicella profunda]|uniref:CD3073 family putative ECF transporter S component n=1 Tax=Crassaminicella profunda TaxID=1286698 RepID=UPI001CA77B09|nr:CD3073 family putative ECF transporter S component [Crassaminicella profunda]QZY55954.1 ECF transporter S component [Crassaminicella profunda]